MPRRITEVVPVVEPPKKKSKLVLEEQLPNLDASFCDDEALPPGIVFKDIQQKKWRIGKPIGIQKRIKGISIPNSCGNSEINMGETAGRGSFGRIYLASDDVGKDVTKLSARYVVKIEPHSNGPLFVEIHCLLKAAVVSKVKAWRQMNKNKCLGMPIYIASGSFTDENTGTKYRFLVLPRYDIDLQKIIVRTKVLDLKNVLVLAIQILDVLEYLHNQGYTHSDIKSSNLMLGFDGGKFGKTPILKPTPSFQKDTKEVAVLSGKFRKVKSGKSRSSNYYDDEDFIVKEHKSPNETEQETNTDKRLATVKSKLRKILSDKDSRTLHRHHAFNLRQLSNCVNYDDMNSSVCSDQSYQRLLDDFGHKLHAVKFNKDTKTMNIEVETENILDEIHRQAVLSQCHGQIYLLDYGLASKFVDSDGRHKEFAMDARKAHDGTLEYSSRDSHIGAHSRRSDLETLAYNVLDWLTGSLPWKTTNVLAEPDLVHVLKKNFMSDIKMFLKTCFKTECYPQFIEKYLQYVSGLGFTEKPDYDYCRSIFTSELLKNGYDKGAQLNFSELMMSPLSRKKILYTNKLSRKNTPADFIARNGIKKTYERENFCLLESNFKNELVRHTLNSSSDGVRKPCTSRNFFISDADLVARLKKSLLPHDVFGKKLSPKNLRSTVKKTVQRKRGKRNHRNSVGKFGNFMGSARQFTWAEILARNPEDIIRKERNAAVDTDDEDDDDNTCKYRIRKLSNASTETSDTNLQPPLLQKDYLKTLNPTYAMKDVVACFEKKLSGKPPKEPENVIENLKGYTPEMIKYYKLKEKREAKEIQDALKIANAAAKKELTEQIEPRCTRSMKNKAMKANEHTIITRQKTKSIGKGEDIKDEKEVKSKSNSRTRSKDKESGASKKEVKIVDSPKKQAIKPKKQSTRRSPNVVTNRRRLRSSKRKKE